MLSEQEVFGISKLRKNIKSDFAYSEFIQFGMDLDHDVDDRTYCDKNIYKQEGMFFGEEAKDIQMEFVKSVHMFLKEFRPNQYRIIMEDDCVKVERK